MRILLDCDGVLGDFASEVIRFCNLFALPPGERALTLEDATDFDILESLGLGDYQEQLDQHMLDSDYCAHMPVLDGAQDFVDKLRDMDHEVVVVTSPYRAVETWCGQRTEWLWRHFSIHADDVIFARNKGRVDGDLLVDDKPENLISWRSTGILLDRPWNRDTQGPFRANNYAEVIARLRWLDVP